MKDNFQFSIFNYQKIRNSLVNWIIGLLPACRRGRDYSPPGGAGQSILEILIALTLIIMFLTSVVILQLFSVRNISYSENKSAAAKLARQQLDRVRVIRDSAGFDSLLSCTASSGCFINILLSPVAVTPTGIFDQVVTMQPASGSDCPMTSITPAPTSYLVTVRINLKGASALLTPTPIAQLSSCLTDWR